MALAWMKRSKRPTSVDDLVARAKYTKALELMRQEFAQRFPSATERLRFADVLVLAGRSTEAVPVLLGVADEQERYGFPDKALEALRRAAEIDPDQPEVIDRIVAIRTAPPAGWQEGSSEEDPRSASDSWGSALDGAFAASTAPSEESEEEAGQVDTGFDSSILAAGSPAATIDEGNVEGASPSSDDPAAQSTPELDAGLLEPLDQEEELEADALEPLDEGSEMSSERGDGRPFGSVEELEAEVEGGARGLLAEGASRADTPRLTAPDGHGEEELTTEARALLSKPPPRAEELRPLLTEEELDDDRAIDIRALDGGRKRRGLPRSLVSREDVEGDLTGDARALMSGGPDREEFRPLITEDDLKAEAESETGPPPRGNDAQPLSNEEQELHGLVVSLGQREGPGAVFFDGLGRGEFRRVARGLRRRLFPPGEMVIREGDRGSSMFFIARGSVRILVMGGHGQPFEIRRIEEGDFFGEMAVLSGRPRSATVVAASACEILEIEREALDVLVALRPAVRALLDEACEGRSLSPEESAVRSLPPEAADPARAAEALRAHFGDCNWSPRVRLHLSRLMMDVGRQDDALAILAGVAEDLARRGQAQKAIAVLKKVETIQRRGVEEVCLAPLKAGRRSSSARLASKRRAAPRAVKEAAFREWVGSLLRETAVLAERSAASIQEGAEGAGEEQGRHLAG
jgi:CRP-like cAMP-binding protein